ncbi:MAG: hypothetical protein J6A15_09795 [Clostridia bacterium]|nr:hypothetical protein [Clostridia bacterium]
MKKFFLGMTMAAVVLAVLFVGGMNQEPQAPVYTPEEAVKTETVVEEKVEVENVEEEKNVVVRDYLDDEERAACVDTQVTKSSSQAAEEGYQNFEGNEVSDFQSTVPQTSEEAHQENAKKAEEEGKDTVENMEGTTITAAATTKVVEEEETVKKDESTRVEIEPEAEEITSAPVVEDTTTQTTETPVVENTTEAQTSTNSNASNEINGNVDFSALGF